MWNLVLLLSLVPTPHAWVPTRSNTRRIALSTKIMALPMDDLAKTGDEQNPCWEDLYDDDCVMSNAAAANFVASKWIKGLPCGQGLEDCDMPEDLTLPETRPEAGVDHVDVMEFLGLHRAEGINNDKNRGSFLQP
ncbi:predicted protein [Phaeodactylum tricornutum CCAP 1055/1]|uniref:Uncharacterized protein n=3 Tax=Phaeodactylum tricornutum TaxID=2850 RepID=B7GDD4_PHATC|nr:predicted protein [Phaeodactylum tricornutum CCAP 1055/1]EEC43241.1 predicted protein [Phaeodactylum tricornutum CCAP 1055/1]|eukprot:XP_002185109.1 predicted protein [Phaeodactylum tricornutum CCAP 1055/1]